jgi:hypothetical protein
LGFRKEYQIINILNNKKIKALEDEVKELSSQFDQILDKLDNENFSKDWDEYLKWKEMKDKLPDLEEMLKLKELKRLIKEREVYLIIKTKVKSDVIEFESTYGNVAKAPDQRTGKMNFIGKSNPTPGLVTVNEQLNQIDKEIALILEHLRRNKTNEDLVDLLKLYAISTDWIKP